MTAHDPLAALRAATAAREAAGLRRVLQSRSAGPGGVTDLASNDYLGLATDSRVIKAAAEGAYQWGTGATGSRLVTGTTSLHTALEQELAGFTGAPAALVFSSGYLANLAALTALAAALGPARLPGQARAAAPPQVLIISDARNHASLIDACRLAHARVEITPHQDTGAVERALTSRREPAALVVTESAFSTGGGNAPLATLHRLTRAHGGMLVIDEAHALGVVGPEGRGCAWEAGIAAEPDVVRVVSLSKSLGAQGGAVLGAPEVIDTLVDTGRGFIFDTALAPPAVAAARCALHLLMANPELPRLARRHAQSLAQAAGEAGFETGLTGAAIVSVVLGDPGLAVQARLICASEGVAAGCFRPPSVPPGESRLRLAARATLGPSDLGAARRALAAVRDHVAVASPVGRK